MLPMPCDSDLRAPPKFCVLFEDVCAPKNVAELKVVTVFKANCVLPSCPRLYFSGDCDRLSFSLVAWSLFLTYRMILDVLKFGWSI